MNHIAKVFLLITLGLFMASCLNSANDLGNTDELLLTLDLNNINEEIIAGNDTLSISRLRLLVGPNFLHNGDGDTLLINQNTYQLNHLPSGGLSEEIKGLAQGTFESDIIYNTLNFEIKKAEVSFLTDPNIDEDFTQGESESERFSIIINGIFNSQSFEFKSTRNFTYEFTFQNLTDGTSNNLRYNLNMQANIESWFQNPDEQGLLNPEDTSNASIINDNIGLSVSLN